MSTVGFVAIELTTEKTFPRLGTSSSSSDSTSSTASSAGLTIASNRRRCLVDMASGYHNITASLLITTKFETILKSGGSVGLAT
jgi:hypothetical protein